jgi:hypothetical protein
MTSVGNGAFMRILMAVSKVNARRKL